MSILPAPYEYRQGIQFSWNNYTQDIKGFIKKKVSGLHVNSQFNVEFNVAILTYMSEECIGIGGSSGKDVTVKASLLTKEPIKYISDEGLFPNYRVDINDGLYGGEDVDYLGNIGLAVACDDTFLHQEPVWEVKNLTNEDNLIFTLDASGEALLYLSIDSGVGGQSRVYITELSLSLNEI